MVMSVCVSQFLCHMLQYTLPFQGKAFFKLYYLHICTYRNNLGIN